jgi:hypothetical protein
MSIRNVRIVFIGKLLLAALSLVALVALPARELMPSVSLGLLLLYVAAGVVGVLALLILGAICSLQFSQFILRMGGTDPQWFWFSSEPRGLVALRKGKVVDVVESHHAS